MFFNVERLGCDANRETNSVYYLEADERLCMFGQIVAHRHTPRPIDFRWAIKALILWM